MKLIDSELKRRDASLGQWTTPGGCYNPKIKKTKMDKNKYRIVEQVLNDGTSTFIPQVKSKDLLIDYIFPCWSNFGDELMPRVFKTYDEAESYIQKKKLRTLTNKKYHYFK